MEHIINKALEKDRELRYQDANDLRADLERLKRDTTTARLPVAAPGPATGIAVPRVLPVLFRAWKLWLLAGALASVLAFASYNVFFRRAQALTERDSILLADFVNTTGDSVFDGTLRQALAVKLEESPFLHVAPEQPVRETLRLMNRSPDERITGTIAREICQRQNIKAMLESSIASLGATYVITLNALNCQTGEFLARTPRRWSK
ncbi:MAG TPA: hypothetical protein VKE24_13280 [Candidatus Acidoferrales bacterium]|nr:hypothetical protein [Candidatus Acidoferrales bacterium]